MNTERNPQTFLEVPGLCSSIMKIPAIQLPLCLNSTINWWRRIRKPKSSTSYVYGPASTAGSGTCRKGFTRNCRDSDPTLPNNKNRGRKVFPLYIESSRFFLLKLSELLASNSLPNGPSSRAFMLPNLWVTTFLTTF